MGDLLVDLVRAAERTVASGYYDVEDRGSPGPGLSAVLRSHPSFPVIAEVKIASPSRGRLTSHSPGELIDAYRGGGAAALSVLTEPERFLGSLDALRRSVLSGLPVLMKDFIVSGRQLRAAAALGAGTVLLIQEVFDALPETRDELIDRAHAMDLEVLLEAGSEAAMLEAVKSDADLVGINQRNLRTFEVDRGKGARLLPRALAAGRPVVVMSGLESKKAVEELRDLGASGVLVGGGLTSSSDPAAMLRGLEVPR